jgi:hypothetical protein
VSDITDHDVGVVYIYLIGAAPNRASIGVTNGIAQILVSCTRAFGPAATNSLYSLSIKTGLLGGWFVYYILTTFAITAVYVATLLPKQPM